jgi:polypeptide N-acetylgalactosaminyltransferase
MIFHNENLSVLLRSVHSVLNLTPPRFLREIILVDDSSHPDEGRFYEKHYVRLTAELENYCKKLPKVRLVRLKRRRGLMVARMEGAWRATGDALVFLDSHIEATPGWIEPLLSRIKEGAEHVVVPSIDALDNHDFTYRAGAGLGILQFTWALNQQPAAAKIDDPDPQPSPVMAGGLFAANREHFLYLGGYDQEMQLYAGEEMEIGFRTWMCGGTVELIPCSHVGHVFRTPKHWQGQVYKVPGEAIARNRLRTAEIWMDEYKDMVKLTNVALQDIGPLEKRRDLRNKLKCRSYKWYLENQAPWLRIPKYTKKSRKGSLENVHHHACIDSLSAKSEGNEYGAYPCHGMHGSQAVLMDDDGYLLQGDSSFSLCSAALPSGDFRLARCDPAHRWTWQSKRGQYGVLLQPSSGKCLAAEKWNKGKQPQRLVLRVCSDSDTEQMWTWKA